MIGNERAVKKWEERPQTLQAMTLVYLLNRHLSQNEHHVEAMYTAVSQRSTAADHRTFVPRGAVDMMPCVMWTIVIFTICAGSDPARGGQDTSSKLR